MDIRKVFTNNETTINSFGNPLLFEGNTLTIVDGKWYINGIDTGKTISEIAPSNLGLKLYTEPENNESFVDWFNKNVALINDRINALHKELTYWDLYKLSKQVENPGDLDSTFNTLTPGQSLVINTPTNFEQNGNTYARGDVVVRLLDNTAALIKTPAQGVYVPRVIVSGNIITIQYSYSKEVPSDSTEPIDIDLSGVDVQSSVTYGIWAEITNDNYVFPVEYYPSDDSGEEPGEMIQPYIKFFNESKEEVYCQYSLTQSSGNFTVSNIPNSIVKYIQIK